MRREDRGDLHSHSDVESRIAPSVNLALVGEAFIKQHTQGA